MVKYFDFNEDDLRTAIEEKITAIGLQRRTLSIRIFKSLKVILITNMQIQKKRKTTVSEYAKVFGLRKEIQENVSV